MKKNKAWLHREWARVLDMCEGTGVNPETCWKFEGNVCCETPKFTQDVSKYEFMVAILEGKPVFVGHIIYDDGIPTVVGLSTQYILFNDKHNCSWNPPKKTFKLNGVELPCPVFDIPKSSLSIRACFPGIQETATFNFPDEYDAKKVIDCISKLLMDNTK